MSEKVICQFSNTINASSLCKRFASSKSINDSTKILKLCSACGNKHRTYLHRKRKYELEDHDTNQIPSKVIKYDNRSLKSTTNDEISNTLANEKRTRAKQEYFYSQVNTKTKVSRKEHGKNSYSEHKNVTECGVKQTFVQEYVNFITSQFRTTKAKEFTQNVDISGIWLFDKLMKYFENKLRDYEYELEGNIHTFLVYVLKTSNTLDKFFNNKVIQNFTNFKSSIRISEPSVSSLKNIEDIRRHEAIRRMNANVSDVKNKERNEKGAGLFLIYLLLHRETKNHPTLKSIRLLPGESEYSMNILDEIVYYDLYELKEMEKKKRHDFYYLTTDEDQKNLQKEIKYIYRNIDWDKTTVYTRCKLVVNIYIVREVLIESKLLCLYMKEKDDKQFEKFKETLQESFDSPNFMVPSDFMDYGIVKELGKYSSYIENPEKAIIFKPSSLEVIDSNNNYPGDNCDELLQVKNNVSRLLANMKNKNSSFYERFHQLCRNIDRSNEEMHRHYAQLQIQKQEKNDCLKSEFMGSNEFMNGNKKTKTKHERVVKMGLHNSLRVFHEYLREVMKLNIPKQKALLSDTSIIIDKNTRSQYDAMKPYFSKNYSNITEWEVENIVPKNIQDWYKKKKKTPRIVQGDPLYDLCHKDEINEKYWRQRDAIEKEHKLEEASELEYIENLIKKGAQEKPKEPERPQRNFLHPGTTDKFAKKFFFQ